VSLLADLLSKVKYKSASIEEGRKTDVPPDLKRVVSNSAEKETTKKRILILSVLVFLAIVVGVGAVYLMELYIKPPKKVVGSQLPVARQTEDRSQKSVASSQESDVSRLTHNAQRSTLNATVAKPKPTKALSAKRQELSVEKSLDAQRSTLNVQQAEEQRPEPKTEPKASNIESRESSVKNSLDAQRSTHNALQQDSQKDVYLYTARTYESKKDYHQALLNYKKAMEIDPGNYIIMNNISSVLIHLGSFEESIKYAKNVLTIKKDHVPSLINIGIAYIRLNNQSEGEAYLSKALSIEPSNSYALLNLGLLYEKRGDNDKAYGYFSKLSEIGNIHGHLGIARIAEKQGRNSDAVRIYREILSMNNIDPKTRKLVNDRLLLLGN